MYLDIDIVTNPQWYDTLTVYIYAIEWLKNYEIPL